MEEDRLEKAVTYIRKNYFPKWDRAHEWIFKCSSSCREIEFFAGKCIKEIKTIYLRELPENDTDLYLLLIHEICHSNTGGHAKKWQERMLKIANHAIQIGGNILSDKIIDEVKACKEGIIVRAITIYSDIKEIVYDREGRISFEDVRTMIAHQYGGYSIVDRYKRCRQEYKKALEEYENYKIKQMNLKTKIANLEE